ncbi:galactose-binding like protein [Testicularia cyperi]|uniref:Galactose-binding like protein n=1 Tax=Testicularia cyperi TaxID=1882483 RepID=A0A317XGZ3_9BASI|nr:galactose-binding like protein [Testicularia cyperi]
MTKLWQSDGSQPHLVNIQFARRTLVTHVSIYLDVKQDDSYTPTKIAVLAGTNYRDLVQVRERTFESPQGWKHFRLDKSDSIPEEEENDDNNDEEMDADKERDGHTSKKVHREGIHVWLIQICILANHLNGKDTHVRRLMVFGPKTANDHQDRIPGPSAKRALQDSAILGHSSRRKGNSAHLDDEAMLYEQPPRTGTNGAQTAAANQAAERNGVTFTLAALLRSRESEQNQDHDSDPPSHILNLFGNIR